MQVYMHVNYIERIFNTDEIARRAADSGFDGIELRGWDLLKTGVPLERYLHQTCQAATNQGLHLVLGYPTACAEDDSQKRTESMKDLTLVIQTAAEYGVNTLNVFASAITDSTKDYYAFEEHGSALVTQEQAQATVEFFKEAGDVAAQYGMTLCFETHNHHQHDLAQPTLDLLNAIDHDHVRANFDYGNIILNPNNQGIDKEVELLKDKIGYVHLKNMRSSRRSGVLDTRGVPLSEGDINHYLLVSKLLSVGYRGPWTIENVMQGDKRRFMTEDQAYLRDLLHELTPSVVQIHQNS